MSKLLKEAMVDAKAVRETALANARLALEEAFAPRLQSMLTKKLKEEELDLEDEESEEVEVSDEVEEGSYSEDDEGEAEEEIPAEDEVEVSDEVEVADEEEVASEEPELDLSDEEEEEDIEEDSFDLESIIKELEQELDVEDEEEAIEESADADEESEEEEEAIEESSCSEDDESEEEAEEIEEQSSSSELGKGGEEHVNIADSDDEELPPETKKQSAEVGNEDDNCEKVAEIDEEIDLEIVEESEESEEESEEEEAVEGSVESDDEEINLEEILRELEEDTKIEEAEDDSEISELKTENEKLQKENDEYRKVYKFLRGKLNEVNLLNAKLLYTNKLFKKFGLSEDQKIKVVESFDLTKNVREAKLVYATLGESFGSQTESVQKTHTIKKEKTEKNPLTEGIASKAIKSTKPSKQILSEGNEMANRFKKLAGIKS